MTSSDTAPEVRLRPMRADARRNYDKLIEAARDAFAEEGTAASLEEIARRAEVGIGTLYRNFPTRQALLEAVYVEEVEDLCRTAKKLHGDDPWKDLVEWLHNFVGYVARKQALAEELFTYMGRDANVFQNCRAAFTGAGEPLLVRAQEAKAARTDMGINEVLQLVGAVSKIAAPEDQIERILDIALDGLRFQDT